MDEACKDLIREFTEYARKVNEYGEQLSELQDKETYHLLDGTRAIISFLRASADFEFEDYSRVEPGEVEPVGAMEGGTLRSIV